MIRKGIKRLLISSIFIATSFCATQAVLADESFSLLNNQVEITDFTTAERVNIRSGPSIDYEALTILDIGETVYAINYSSDEWSQIVYKDYVGYIKTEFLSTDNNYQEAAPVIIESTIEPTIEPTYNNNHHQHSSKSVELPDWSEVKETFTIGADAAVYDIISGRTYYVRSFSNGQHADVETITAEDTAIMKETFGGVWSWDVRPVLVTVNGRTFAGSINGMPHGGDTNPNNNMDGQVCIHFLNSTTHNGNSDYTRLHQEILIKAYNMAQ